MSSKNNDQNLLIPGELGWEVWSYTDTGIQLTEETAETQALNIDKLPSNKSLLMSFPVRELTNLQLWIPSSEQHSADDLVTLHVEDKGLAQGEEHGILHQFSTAKESEEQNLLSIDVLRAPKEGTLPAKSPDSFTVSPRSYALPASSAIYWKEFNRWVIAITDEQGTLIHYQGFSARTLSAEIASDSKFILGHLQIQSILKTSPAQYLLWTSDETVLPEGFDTFQKALQHPVITGKKPAPIIPPIGTLLPADTRAERLAKKQKKQQSLILTVIAILCISIISFAIYTLWDLEKRATDAQTEAEDITLSNQTILDHYAKWEELKPLVDTENNPISLLLKSTRSIPNNNVRLTRAEFTHQTAEKGVDTVLSVTLTGEAPNLGDASKFEENLLKSKALEHLTWLNQEPSKTKTGWRFVYRADKK